MGWLSDIFSLGKSKDKDFALDSTGDSGDIKDTTSSAAKSNQEREDERSKQDRLDDFLKLQKKQDADGEWSEKDQESAESDFSKSEELKARQSKTATVRNVETEVENLFVDLESNQRLLPYGNRLEGYGVKVVDGRLIWTQIGLPSMTGKSKYMVLQITVDSPAESMANDWDWVRSHD